MCEGIGLKGASDMRGLRRPSVVVDLLFEIPGGGLLTRFCYVAYGTEHRGRWSWDQSILENGCNE